jgi:anaerobic magnesium-protoporphyrin IX monomethyl ester cyclase
MRLALLNPNWTFEGSIYFGCREPHLPLEFGYAKMMLERAGHHVEMIDAQLFDLEHGEVADRLRDWRPDFTVVTTAPSYLFWRCAPPELRVPRALLDSVREVAGRIVAIGPHGSTTPRATLHKLGADVVVMGECEEVLPRLAHEPWPDIAGIAFDDGHEVRVQGGPHAGGFTDLPPLSWPDSWIERHGHHHHRFDTAPERPGAEVEASRGCPYHCSFCAKEMFRDRYRRRALPAVLEEVDRLIGQGVDYVYFIDEIFLPNRPLLEALAVRDLRFGVQTRIDLWKPELIELLGRAGCVSIEAGVESITPEGRAALDKDCRMSTDELAQRLILAKRHVAFVQANMISSGHDDEQAVRAWCAELRAQGVWANEPVPLFPYPGSPDYRRLWGPPDERAWERAHTHYLAQFGSFSELQDERPRPLADLEHGCACA